MLGHIDAALTLDTEKLGLWPGGHFYFLGQNNHGTGINELVGSATSISNYEARPYTQLTEFLPGVHATSRSSEPWPEPRRSSDFSEP